MAKNHKHDDPIVIVGSGVFGLSTALHLCRRGYRHVTVLDRADYDANGFDYFSGADAASADKNKIVRSAYGAQSEYQDLSTEAIAAWHAWNADLAARGGNKEDEDTRVFIPCGNVSLSSRAAALPPWEQACIDGMARVGLGHTQIPITRTTTTVDNNSGGGGIIPESYLDPFRRASRGLPRCVGVLDATGGMAVAARACRYALAEARALGAKFVFGADKGAFEALCHDGVGTAVTGVRTRDGVVHAASTTIMACGAWTPTLVPELDGLCEATAGSVAMFKLPVPPSSSSFSSPSPSPSSPSYHPHRRLWDRFSPDRFPTWTCDMRDGASGGLYGFPRDDEGWVKIGYRGFKYTNPVAASPAASGGGRPAFPVERSTPTTTRSTDGMPSTATHLPALAHRVIQGLVDRELPELSARRGGPGISAARMCWYTDTFDNHFVVDWVPGRGRSLMVATGGSGHAFKYLPVIGSWVADVMEGKGLERPAVRAWRWRSADAEGAVVVNRLMQGSCSEKALVNTRMVRVVPDDVRGDSKGQTGEKARL